MIKDFKQWLMEYNQQTTDLYQSFSQALDKFYNGKVTGNPPLSLIITSEVVSKLGFDFSELMRAGVIERSPEGNYQLNKDLASTNGKLGKAPPVPYVPGSPVAKRAELYKGIQTMPSPKLPPSVK